MEISKSKVEPQRVNFWSSLCNENERGKVMEISKFRVRPLKSQLLVLSM